MFYVKFIFYKQKKILKEIYEIISYFAFAYNNFNSFPQSTILTQKHKKLLVSYILPREQIIKKYMYSCNWIQIFTKWIIPAAVNHTDINIETSCAKRIELDVLSTFKYCNISGTVIRRSARRKRRPLRIFFVYYWNCSIIFNSFLALTNPCTI